METLECWSCKDHGRFKERGKHGMMLTQERPHVLQVTEQEEAGPFKAVGTEMIAQRAPVTRHGASGFGVCLTGLQSSFGLVCPCWNPTPPTWHWNVYP